MEASRPLSPPLAVTILAGYLRVPTPCCTQVTVDCSKCLLYLNEHHRGMAVSVFLLPMIYRNYGSHNLDKTESTPWQPK